ncbi:hypothetical protein PYW08_003731 [Mythimna loreyi]|uniref:Uncharacterized protein n=1 Tax=Mythimna loreyi TaxID=667449 RepID=A0ACC2QW37_9NEOP|nr:hypothetical protein PYW08_003731 [Mythimna loreyi]
MVMDNRVSEDNETEHNSSIFITNFQNGDVVNYSLVLVKGIITRGNSNNNEKLICTLKSENFQNKSQWDVYNGEFKVIIELKRGENVIELEYTEQQKKILLLDYTPRKTNLRVTPVYIICQGHDGCFQSPPEIDNSTESACARIALGAKLIQCLTAEKLFESGIGRKTFQLEHEVNPKKPECIIFKSGLNVNKARKMKQTELWSHFGRELMLSDLGSNERKFLGFISCTRYKGTDIDKPMTHEEIISLTEAYAALGGGGLALFGTACLYTWPTTVEEIVPKFLDATPVNVRRFMDDSGYRGTLGGCFATTLGSVFHELGHTFDLGHTKDGIMGRGFDNLDRVFVMGEKRSALVKDNMNNFSGKPVQHSTVSLQRNISVTMNVAEPLRVLGPRSKTTLDLVAIVERLGTIFAPVKYDMQGNVDKIKKLFKYDKNSCLLELMLAETATGKPGAESVLWLNRGMLFFEIMFTQILCHVETNNIHVNMKKIFTVAYEGSVKRYHNWITQQLFTFICKMSPTLPDVIKAFEMEDNLKLFGTKVENLHAAIHEVRCKIDDFFKENNIFNIPIEKITAP